MRITYQYRLNPSPAQRSALQRQLDCCRFVYNKALETRKNAWEERQVSVSRYDTTNMIPQWKAENEWLKEGHAQAMQEALTRLDFAFRAFFRRVKSGEKDAGYPRFRGRGWYDSFTYPQEKGNWRFLFSPESGPNDQIRGIRDNGHCQACPAPSGFAEPPSGGSRRVRLSKIGDVKIVLHRPLLGYAPPANGNGPQVMGQCKTLTIRRDRVGNWYACFSCEVKAKPLPVNDKVVGVDLGLSTFAYMSDGTKIERQRWMKQDAKDIARLQRKKEAFAKGSPERHKVIHALCHAYERAANRRKNFAHQASRKLVNAYQFIAFEKLDIQEMQVTGNKFISRNIADVAWGQFVQFTAYKAANAGRGVALVNPRGTTQRCSGCGEIVAKDLSVRLHNCPHCGLKLNPGAHWAHNAALNILALGLQSMGESPRSSPMNGGE